MTLPSKQEVEALVSELTSISQSYSDTPDLNGYVSRAQIISKAKELVRTLVSPDMTPNYHGLNVSRSNALLII
jgi:hypothetical protein